MPFLIRDLLLAGALGGLNCLFYAQTQRSTATAAENWFYFVEKGRPGSSWLVNEMNFSNYPKTRQLIDIFVEKCQPDLNLTDFWVFENVTLKYLTDTSRSKT